MRTFDETFWIKQLTEEGKSIAEISRALGISHASVQEKIQNHRVAGNEINSVNNRAEIIIRQMHLSPTSPLTIAYSYILGLYLGDGYINKMARVYRLRISLDAKYPLIIQACHDALQTLLPDNTIGRVENFYQDKLSHVDVSAYYRDFPTLFPQHGLGVKHNREIKLTDWQHPIVEANTLEFFRGLYHSDGSRFSNVVKGKDYPRYHFTNMSGDIIDLYTAACDRLGLAWTRKERRPGDMNLDIYISKRKDVDYLDSVIGPKA
jgi:biotin operon repressor